MSKFEKNERILRNIMPVNQNTTPHLKGGLLMSLFEKKKTIVLFSEAQKDEYIEKLDQAHVSYDVREKKDDSFDNKITYIIKLKASDLKKVI